MLKLKNLVCSRNENMLFKNVSFEILAGDVLQIIGKNGIGKTTLLRTIAGLLRPATGQIELNNMEICYIGHKSGLHPDLSVQQNLEFLQILGSQNSEPAKTIDAALEYFALENKKNIKCSELSAGQAQRVSLARLCFTTAKLWLLDEPLANLDLCAHKLLSVLCVKHLATGGSIVLATHNDLELDPYAATTLQLESI